MQKFAAFALATAVCAVISVLMGLFIRLGSTWDAGWRAAGGCFAFCLIVVAVGALPADSAWSRWIRRALWLGTAIGGYLVAGGALGKPYERLGIAALIYCATVAWLRYRRTDHYRAHMNTRLAGPPAANVTVEDPDHDQGQVHVKEPVRRSADGR